MRAMFFEYFKAICTKNGTTPTAVVKELGLSTGKVTAWKNGSIPKAETLRLLADHLHVPVYTFFGGSDMSSYYLIKDFFPDGELTDAEEIELIEIYRKLKISGRRQLTGKAYELLDAQDGVNTGDEAISPPNVDMVATLSDNRVKK